MKITPEAELRKKLREAVANYMSSEGCSCCENVDEHAKHKATLAKLLNIPMYKDKSGYDFSKYETKAIRSSVNKVKM